MDREIQIKRSYIYFYLYYVLVRPISSTLSDCAQYFESCFKHPRNFNCYLVTSPRILEFCCSFVASFHDLATLIEKSLPICFSNTLPTFRNREILISSPPRDFRGKYQGYAWSTVRSDAAPRENLSTTLFPPVKKRRETRNSISWRGMQFDRATDCSVQSKSWRQQLSSTASVKFW